MKAGQKKKKKKEKKKKEKKKERKITQHVCLSISFDYQCRQLEICIRLLCFFFFVVVFSAVFSFTSFSSTSLTLPFLSFLAISILISLLIMTFSYLQSCSKKTVFQKYFSKFISTYLCFLIAYTNNRFSFPFIYLFIYFYLNLLLTDSMEVWTYNVYMYMAVQCRNLSWRDDHQTIYLSLYLSLIITLFRDIIIGYGNCNLVISI